MRKMLAAALTLLTLGVQAGTATAEPVKIAIGEWKPFISADLPGYGPHTERVVSVLKAAGYDLEFEFVPWKRGYEMVKEGKYAATFSWYTSDEREADFLVPTVPVDVQTGALFYKKDRFPDGLKVETLQDIKDQGLKPLGVMSYWYMDGFAKLGVDVQELSKPELAWKMLDSGRADVFIEDVAVAKETLGAEAATIVQGNVMREDPMYILFSRTHPMGQELHDAWEKHAK